MPVKFILDVVIVYFAGAYQLSTRGHSGKCDSYIINSFECDRALVRLGSWDTVPLVRTCLRAVPLSTYPRELPYI